MLDDGPPAALSRPSYPYHSLDEREIQKRWRWRLSAGSSRCEIIGDDIVRRLLRRSLRDDPKLWSIYLELRATRFGSRIWSIMLRFLKNYVVGISNQLGKQYPFVATRDGSDKRRGRSAEMEADLAQTRADLHRAAWGGHTNNPRDAQRRDSRDTRTLRERIAEDGAVTTRRRLAATAHTARITQLQNAVCRTPGGARGHEIDVSHHACKSEEAWERQRAAEAEAAKKRESNRGLICSTPRRVSRWPAMGSGYSSGRRAGRREAARRTWRHSGDTPPTGSGS